MQPGISGSSFDLGTIELRLAKSWIEPSGGCLFIPTQRALPHDLFVMIRCFFRANLQGWAQ
jgi:hypothetical protein